MSMTAAKWSAIPFTTLLALPRLLGPGCFLRTCYPLPCFTVGETYNAMLTYSVYCRSSYEVSTHEYTRGSCLITQEIFLRLR
jgi:hypothetical protein